MKLIAEGVAKTRAGSHPARGAWIEILVVSADEALFTVAPRKGCVD